MKRMIVFICGLTLGVACTTAVVPRGPESQSLLESYIAAFNRKDVDAMTSSVAEDFAWYYVSGSSLQAQSESRTELAAGLTAYFENTPSVQSSIGETLNIGPYSATVETVSWQTENGQTRQQSALSVYEVGEAGLQRVWYFPEVKAP